jgi:CRISPR-associated protein Csm4
MNAIILKSNPGVRFRFGEAFGAFTEESHNQQKTTSGYLHSDTLWSALVNAWALACPETVESFILACRKGNFKLSSAFYCFCSRRRGLDPQSSGETEPVFFLPKPASLNLFQFAEPKKLKKIKFISKGIWESGLLPGEWFNAEKCTLLQGESIVALKSEIGDSLKLFSTETNPKVRARDLTGREDSFYYQTELFLAENVNWYFLLENNLPETLQADFQTSMQTLVNFGIGGERTTGCGSLTGFQETESMDIKPAEISSYCASVSLVAPGENELTGKSLYQIIKRGGRFLEKGKSLPMVQMLLEGAVFDAEIKGRIVELNKEPVILRYGLNLAIPLHTHFINEEL